MAAQNIVPPPERSLLLKSNVEISSLLKEVIVLLQQILAVLEEIEGSPGKGKKP